MLTYVMQQLCQMICMLSGEKDLDKGKPQKIAMSLGGQSFEHSYFLKSRKMP